ncbi:MAG: hypothetical protein ACE5GH_01840 [Fidelibacterota bacterium]
MPRTEEEYVVASVSYSFGIAPPIMGFAALSNLGNIFKMQNKNPLMIGSGFEKAGRVDDRDDFISLALLPATDGSQQYYLAVTRSGRHYSSKDLEIWTFQSVVPLKR